MPAIKRAVSNLVSFLSRRREDRPTRFFKSLQKVVSQFESWRNCKGRHALLSQEGMPHTHNLLEHSN
jgi:hypothetical protein